jgi:NADH:ubiquinone oxidoreductase subunit F (NADH-binding)
VTGAVSRVLPARPLASLDAYRAAGGGRGLAAARRLGPASVVDEIDASGLRGRGGAGFPTGTKWRTVVDYASARAPSTVVVNGAEGEPGTYKDRTLLRSDPYAVLEGALIAALAVGADRAVVATKSSFTTEQRCLERAMAEVRAAGWAEGVALGLASGPGEYLFGEETALLEVLDGRPPFPRITPPFRQGVDEVGSEPEQPAGTVMAREDAGGAPPTLVDNVETIANVPRILAEGADWFRSVGTAASPGTILCTISGATRRHGVAEVAMGTTLAEAIELIGGGARFGHHLVAALSGVANPLLPAARFATPLTYEDLRAAGSGLGSAGFVVYDDRSDLAAVVAGVSRFLAVESCGQCTPCKGGGLEMADLLAGMCAGQGGGADLARLAELVATVATGARCNLASQQELVVGSLLRLFPDELRRHLDHAVPGTAPEPVAPIRGVGDDGRFELDLEQLGKQPDWSFDGDDSGKVPAERLV